MTLRSHRACGPTGATLHPGAFRTAAGPAIEVYLVGGAVRDALLGRSVKERDYVVVGAAPEDLMAQGYRQVGRDFPVFLHPRTKEEYALARTERKTGPGYRGFVVHAAPDVTLGEDLKRRDLTINALARDGAGRIIDYHGGLCDLEKRILRHISPAFAEDPVRILRVARFAARYAHLGFRVAEETLALMGAMVEDGEVDALVPERVWQELAGALGEARPSRFFDVLRRCGALARLLPEIDRLFGVPQAKEAHPEIDTGVHTMMVLDMAARLGAAPEVRFAALTHDLGKGTTPPAVWPSHKGHEERSVALVTELCHRLRAPRGFCDCARMVARYHGLAHKVEELTAESVLDLLQGLDALRRPERFGQALTAFEADFRGREGYGERAYPQADRLRRLHGVLEAVDAAAVAAALPAGANAAKHIREARIKALAQALSEGRGRDGSPDMQA